MRIYIYHSLIKPKAVRELNKELASANSLNQHLMYLEDFYRCFKKYETRDHTQADYFFVPIFLVGWQFKNLDPWNLIAETCEFLYRKNHIIVATGDFGQRESTPHEMNGDTNPNRAYAKKYRWLDDRFHLIVLESTRLLSSNDIAFLPYPTRWIRRRNRPRDIRVSFMGTLTQPHLPAANIRSGAFERYVARIQDPRTVIVATPAIGSTPAKDVKPKRRGRVPKLYRRARRYVMSSDLTKALQRRLAAGKVDDLMSRSIFTLCPAGYGRWSFRFSEALANGSIPVLLSDDYLLPFSQDVNWDQFCIRVPEKDLFLLNDTLSSVPESEIQAKLQNIRKNRHLFLKAYSMSAVLDFLKRSIGRTDSSERLANRAIKKMRGPSKMGIICVDVTNKCDLACSNCTRLLENQDGFWEMTPDNFRAALRSLKNYKGIIAMIGGNPCMHRNFEELCEIFVQEVPDQFQRGLWSNNVFKYTDLIRKTFGGLNLNTHNNPRATEKLVELYDEMVTRKGFNGGLYMKNSEHAPLLTAVKDLAQDEEDMWDKIANCDINREWSATIIQVNGQLRAYFCEVAASFDLARGGDNGMPVTLDWWQKPLKEFGYQVKKFCPGCGVPARVKGHLDIEETDTYTVSNEDLALKSKVNKKRKIILLRKEDAVDLNHKVTEYAVEVRKV